MERWFHDWVRKKFPDGSICFSRIMGNTRKKHQQLLETQAFKDMSAQRQDEIKGHRDIALRTLEEHAHQLQGYFALLDPLLGRIQTLRRRKNLIRSISALTSLPLPFFIADLLNVVNSSWPLFQGDLSNLLVVIFIMLTWWVAWGVLDAFLLGLSNIERTIFSIERDLSKRMDARPQCLKNLRLVDGLPMEIILSVRSNESEIIAALVRPFKAGAHLRFIDGTSDQVEEFIKDSRDNSEATPSAEIIRLESSGDGLGIWPWFCGASTLLLVCDFILSSYPESLVPLLVLALSSMFRWEFCALLLRFYFAALFAIYLTFSATFGVWWAIVWLVGWCLATRMGGKLHFLRRSGYFELEVSSLLLAAKSNLSRVARAFDLLWYLGAVVALALPSVHIESERLGDDPGKLIGGLLSILLIAVRFQLSSRALLAELVLWSLVLNLFIDGGGGSVFVLGIFLLIARVFVLGCELSIKKLWGATRWATGKNQFRRFHSSKRDCLILKPFGSDHYVFSFGLGSTFGSVFQIAYGYLREYLTALILYFFAGSIFKSSQFGFSSLDATLVRFFSPYYRVIQMSRPGSLTDSLSGGHLKLEGETWKSDVASLISNSRKIVIIVSETPGVVFEMQQVIAADKLGDCILVFPGGYDHFAGNTYSKKLFELIGQHRQDVPFERIMNGHMYHFRSNGPIWGIDLSEARRLSTIRNLISPREVFLFGSALRAGCSRSDVDERTAL